MTYESFAYWYDALMNEAPYEQWQLFVQKKLKQYGRKGAKRILDIGCGTGELAIRLAKEGFLVTGVDLSENMLAIAQAKAETQHVAIEFFQQNMTEIEGFSSVDCATIFCDSLNYLLEENEVRRTFSRIYELLNEDGLLLFDVHSIYKIDHVFQDAVFASNGEEISYIWSCYPLSLPHSVEHELTFFVRGDDGTYERYDELHRQRTYEVVQYQQWLTEAGFAVLEITADFTDKAPSETSERIFFVAKK
ncbi:class I SAM-dependent DNA methyltransferase [Parageobacillus thermoglucosidasius]|uniref:Methyltransferase n=1 Tax=Parageobacillus thermoglucosidasius TaxID=1426 RepID=A0AAN0YU13_PARTM|nr:class I SAM-dependent methyltransferase [Parageobacillus thermoglucosidasius]REK55677.1 MAG: class I SAM-dependent methyltransferase [Geobacillus sp.]AEH47152.1 Methyltransferase type 12 [Parageobacillus thermoglucosidasius C56-YS93]ALF11586.1 methyltransferase [Parageobacillus thermoglucosidasius]ANZ31668.1 methyltransferase [Parageobacillus thermoglucosidasius]APM82405.1 methyltransferase [Parageobacillus thermoglucosidasius]